MAQTPLMGTSRVTTVTASTTAQHRLMLPGCLRKSPPHPGVQNRNQPCPDTEPQLEPAHTWGPGTAKEKQPRTPSFREIQPTKTTEGSELVYSEEESDGWGLRTSSSGTSKDLGVEKNNLFFMVKVTG